MLLNAIIEAGYRPEIKVTYFVPDKTKEGGSYENYIRDVKRVDSTFRTLTFMIRKEIYQARSLI